MAHSIRLSILCRCKWTRKSDLWGKMLQSNIYYYASIKGVLCISGKDVPRRTKKSWKTCQTNQDSCACTRFLCMHNALVHAQRAGPGGVFFWVLALGPGPSSACTRVLCMHKSVVHAQESCACTRILCKHNIFFCSYIIPQTVFSCRGSGGFVRRAGYGSWQTGAEWSLKLLRRRVENGPWPQKRLVKLTFRSQHCIPTESGAILLKTAFWGFQKNKKT